MVEYERKIKYNQIQKEGIVLEDKGKFSESVFAAEYTDFYEKLISICKENLGQSKNAEEKKVWRQKNSNILSIVGGRGTGKTSFMLSILDSLDAGINRLENCAWDSWGRYVKEKGIKLIVLDYIDAGALKSAEDIVNIVVAKMYQHLEELDGKEDIYSERRQNLMRRFDEIYKALNKNQETFVEGQSALRSLKNFSSSYSVGQKFRKLVNEYNKYICGIEQGNEQESCKYSLVIALDDIDLYKDENDANGNERGGCYELLETLYEYFMIPGLIVITAYNEQLLQRRIKKYLRRMFYKEYQSVDENDKKLLEKMQNERKERNELYQQFLEKVLPVYSVVFLPDFTRADYVNMRERLKIVVDKDRFKWLTNNDENSIDVKQFVLRYIAYATGIHYDIAGQKKHFFEPRNLRDLHNVLSFLDKMCLREADSEKKWSLQSCDYYHDGRMCYIEPDPVKDQDLEWYDANCTRLLQYIYNQLGDVKLTSEEQFLLEELLSVNIVRRCQDLLNKIREMRGKYLKLEDNYHLTQVDYNWKYSYGELLRNLFYATRFREGYTKEFIYCILASNTTILTRCYHNYQYAKNEIEKLAKSKEMAEMYKEQLEQLEEKKEDAKDTLKSVLGSSISGSWSNEMIPKAYGRVSQKAMGKWSDVTVSMNVGSMNLQSLDKVFEAIELNPELIDTLCDVEKCKEAKEFLKDLQYFCMFFTKISGPGEEYKFGFEIKRTEIEVKEVKEDQEVRDVKEVKYLLGCTAQNACFNILNFVANSFQYEEYLNGICEDLADACSKYKKDQLALESKSKEEFLDKQVELKGNLAASFKKLSLLEEYKDWEKEDSLGEFAIPFYQFDLTYNLIKRLADKLQSKTRQVDSMDIKKYAEYCGKVYEDIADKLEEQDKVYGTDYAKHYRECPFVQRFDQMSDDNLKTWINKQANILLTQYGE